MINMANAGILHSLFRLAFLPLFSSLSLRVLSMGLTYFLNTLRLLAHFVPPCKPGVQIWR